MSSEEKNPTEKKIDVILTVVQNFGLNFIQKIGELKHSISVLTDQVEKMNKALITVKGLEPKINEIASMKKDILTELHYLQSQIKASSFKQTDIIKMKTGEESVYHIEVLEEFQRNLTSYSTITDLTRDLEEVKRKVYEYIGGHRILYEIGETIKLLNQKDSISDSDLKSLKEKITFWMNKLK